MNKINLIKIISEEIENFDFLGNDAQTKEQEYIDLLKNEELQKQFICDSLLTQNNKIKIINNTNAYINGNFESQNTDDINKITVEYGVNIEYKYDSNKEPLILDLEFDSTNIDVSANGYYDSGNHDTPPSGDAWFDYIDWSQVNVSLYTDDGDEIEFIAFKKAPINIKNLFVREYLSGFISSNTSMDIRDKSNKAAISQFC